MTDIPELTPEQLARRIKASVRKRLIRGELESGEDVASQRLPSPPPIPPLELPPEPAHHPHQGQRRAQSGRGPRKVPLTIFSRTARRKSLAICKASLDKVPNPPVA